MSRPEKEISLEHLRKVLGLEPVKDAAGNIVQEAPLSLWANFRQRALDVAIAEINKKTDLKIELESLERSKYRRVTTLTLSLETVFLGIREDKNTKEVIREKAT
jgi:hypothetical protein